MSYTSSEEFREQTEWERKLFSRLLERSFAGREKIREQLSDALVRNIDQDGSLEIQVRYQSKADVPGRIPTEAHCPDQDGTNIHILLHVVDGLSRELEFYKDDGSKVIQKPILENLQFPD